MENAQNSVTIFTRGIASFSRVVDLEQKVTSLNIPFRKDAMDEVLATLETFGPVRYRVPPSYTPENVNDNRLHLDPSDVLYQLATSLSGSAVAVKVTGTGFHEGTLVGVDKKAINTQHGATLERSLVVLTVTGLKRVAWDSIQELQFTDQKIQDEVNAALARNLQNIKPDSTFIELELERTVEQAAQAIVEYSIPLAAWKMRYAFRNTDDGCYLIGAAICDNNTDEDWLDVYVNVVTGDPITFRTDLNEVRVPQREFIKLVEDAALGNVSVEKGFGSAGAALLGAGQRAMKFAARSMEACDGEAMECLAMAAPESSAEFVEVEATDVGDFQIFSAKEPLTIRANKSAIIPMFKTKVEASTSLLYKQSNHATRPYRSLKFNNDTNMSLGKGKAVVHDYDSKNKRNIFAGSAVLEITKPEEDRVLPYCLENGVKVTKQPQKLISWRDRLQISDGVAVSSHVRTQEVVYSLTNVKNEEFEILVEHDFILASNATIGSKCLGDWRDVTFRQDGDDFTPKVDKLKNGVRATLTLPPKGKVNFVVRERVVDESQLTLSNLDNLIGLLVGLTDDLLDDKQVKKCIVAQENFDQQKTEIDVLNQRLTKLTRRCNLLRKNIEAVGENQAQSSQFNEWVVELNNATNEITEIEDVKQPEANDKLKELQNVVKAELRKLKLEWAK